MGIFDKLKTGLKKARENFGDSIDKTLAGFGKIDEELFEELEEILIMADVGLSTTDKIIEKLKQKVKDDKLSKASEIKGALIDEISAIMDKKTASVYKVNKPPKVIIVIGVNGVGKTTSIGKIAANFKKQGKKVILSAADTFRAAAIDQLQIWADRADVQLVKHAEGSDPAAVVFDSIQAAKARNADVLICDTAGRLHNKKNLMNELEKIFRIIDRELDESEKEVLLVLDSTTGQNAVNQAKTFSEVAPLTGIILTKLDGTAKGGIVISITNELNIPVKLIGIGEGIDDLQDFDPTQFAKALF